MKKEDVSYALYLVTDSTPGILGCKDLCAVVEAALKGGVTCVQYRDKTSETGVLIATAKKLHVVTRKYGVPLLINDRVDVAQAVGCEGVHVGQDDTDLASARKILGPDAIIGVSVGNVSEANKASVGGADYLGIGTIFATPTKTNTKDIIGIDGLQPILSYLHSSGSKIKTVCIGGLNASNISHVMWQSTAWDRSLDGVAVVSAIISAPDPEAAARDLQRLLKTPPPFAHTAVTPEQTGRSPAELLDRVPDVMRAVRELRPLSHNMTNLVVQNFAANVALAVGASPIMSNYGEEAADLAALGGGLVVNMGTVTPEGLGNYVLALRAYNAAGRPVVFDPVGAGATTVRRQATKTILNAGYIDVIKGNQSEILSCAPGGASLLQQQQQQKGVDSGPEEKDTKRLATIVRDFAALRKCIVLMTGKTDYLSAGRTVYAIDNGHAYLSEVTGTGCCLGTVVSAAVAAFAGDKLAAVLAGLLHFEVAAEAAAAWETVGDGAGSVPVVRGAGTFVPVFLDELGRIRRNGGAGSGEVVKGARVRVVEGV